jgi:predicted metal-dependent hydrolase
VADDSRSGAGSVTRSGGAGESGGAPGTIMQGDRRKAYRPISPERRRSALEAGLAAYARGDFFEAHELLEPAWMGTSNLAERALYQGLIKLAAGYVHAVRGNPIGLARNLEGARKHLATSLALDPDLGLGAGVDLNALLMEVDVRLASVRSAVAQMATSPTAMLALVEAAPLIR